MQDKMRLTAAVLAAGSTIVTATSVDAGNGPVVEGAKVRHGHAKFVRNGNALRIQSGRNTIIDYNRFDIPAGTSVEFAQQNANSRILNRINSAAPTQIMGSMSSNGRVYFINRAGVVFGKDARIDVNGLFAAAGKMSNSDFLMGRDRVTGMHGTVRNEGTIRAVNEVVLAGRTVVNTGSIETGRGGLVAMVAGESVTLRRSGSNVGIQVAGGAAALQPGGGISQHGTVRAPGGRIVATAGDLASLAVDLSGTVVARAIEVDGGRTGTVRLAGTLDVSGQSNDATRGGPVRVTAGSVHLTSGAAINADGPRGGGTVHVGGGVQGNDASMRNAQRLRVADGAVVSANATHQGNGGTIAFWADGRTDFLGTATARGAGVMGAGGFIEASGKRHLLYDGTVNMLGSGGGANGTLLLDPGFLTVQNIAAGVDTLGMDAVNAALAVGNLVIQNAGVSQDSGIRWQATDTITGLNTSSLTVNVVGPGASASVMAAPSFGSWLGDFTIQTEGGPITVLAGLNRPLGGAITLTAGGGSIIRLNGTSVTSFNSPITFNGPVILGVNTTIISGNAPVTFSGTTTGLGVPRNLTVNSGGVTTFGGSLANIASLNTDAAGSTVFGGNVSLAGNSAINDMASFGAGVHTLTNTGAFTTYFGNGVTGGGTLNVTQGTGALTFGGPLYSISSLNSLSVNAGGAVIFTALVDGAMPLSVNTPGYTTFGGAVGSFVPLTTIDILNGATRVSGGQMATTGNQNYGAMLLGDHATFNAANLTIAGPLGRTGAGLRNMTVNSPGVFTLSGATTNLNDFTTDAGGTFVLGGPMALTGMLAVNDALQLDAPSVVLDAAGGMALSTVAGGGNSLSLLGGGVRTLNGNLTGLANFTAGAGGATVLGADIAASSDVTIESALALAGAGMTRSISTTGAGKIMLKGAVDGPASLDLSAGSGAIAFGAPVGGTAALGGLAINSAGNVSFAGSIDGAMDIAITTTGVTSFVGSVGATTAVNSITVPGRVVFGKGGTMRSIAGQSYGDTTLGVNSVVSSLGGSDIDFNGTINGPYSLSVNTAGATRFHGAIGNTMALSSLTVANGVALNGGAVTTTGGQSYGDATLGSDTTLSSTGGGAITFTGTLDGAQALATNTTGTTRFDGAVGGGTALTQLAVNGLTAINGGGVTTTGMQVYGDTTLGAAANLTSTDSGAISLGSVAGGGNFLGVHTLGNTNLNGTMTGLAGFLADGGGVTTIGGSITATGDIAILDEVMLTLGAHGVTSTLGNVTFGSTVDGLGSLTAGSAGVTTFGGAVGSTSALAQLLVNGASTFGGGAVTTSGNLTLAGPSTFTANTALASGGVLSLGGSADAGAFDLSLAGSQIRFGNGVLVRGRALTFNGPMTGLGDLSLDAATTLNLLGDLSVLAGTLDLGTPGLLVLAGSIDSLHTLIIRGDVRVEGDRTITVRGTSDAIFEGTVNGTTFEKDTLWVNSSGLTAFKKDVGNSMRMLRLETNQPGTIQVAPSAKAIVVIYGELGPFGPTAGGGGVELAQSYSSLWEGGYWPATEARRMGVVDYRRSGTMLLTADLDAGFAPGGFAGSTTEDDE